MEVVEREQRMLDVFGDPGRPTQDFFDSVFDCIVERSWEPFFEVTAASPDLSEEEVIANFFLGFFPEIDDPDDLAVELSTFFEDLQVHAKAKKNQQIVNFCNFFADNAEQLAIDLLAAKKSLIENVQKCVNEEVERAKRLAKTFEEAEEELPEDQIKETQRKFSRFEGEFWRE